MKIFYTLGLVLISCLVFAQEQSFEDQIRELGISERNEYITDYTSPSGKKFSYIASSELYDKNGFLVERHEYNSEGYTQTVKTFNYDRKTDQLTDEYWFLSNDQDYHYWIHYLYNEQGRVETGIQYFKEDTMLIFNLKYNAGGEVVSRTIRNKDGGLMSSLRYETLNDGTIYTYEFNDAEKMVSKVKEEVNGRGDISRSTSLNSSNIPIADIFYEYKYDKKKLLKEIKTLDADKKTLQVIKFAYIYRKK